MISRFGAHRHTGALISIPKSSESGLETNLPSCTKCHAAWPDDAQFCPSCGSAGGDTKTPTTTADAALQVGLKLGKYRIVELIGEGGMGRVYLAEHEQLGRRVAIKVLRSEYAYDTRAKGRFYAEAHAVNQIAHENIVQITDFFEELNYYIMELLRGESLRQLLDREVSLLPARAVNIAIQMASALASVHDANIVHRDLKPDNVFICETGQRRDFVKLLDFGVAKLMSDPGHRAMAETNSGFVIGTPKYMSPEQASGNTVDHRSDVYSFGVLLYEMLTGRRPLDADNFGRMVVLLTTTKPVRPSKVDGAAAPIPKALDALVMKCLELDPVARPKDLRTVVEHMKALAPQLDVDEPMMRSGWRPFAMAGGVAAALSVGLFVTLAEGKREAPPVAAVAEARTVEVVFSSEPAGARITAVGSDELLGITPTALTFERRFEPMAFELSMPGHETVRINTTLERDTRLATRLSAIEPLPRPEAKVKPRPAAKPPMKRVSETPKKLDDRAIMDPFAE